MKLEVKAQAEPQAEVGTLRTLVGLLMILVPWTALWLAYQGVYSFGTGMGGACIACAALEAITRRRMAALTRDEGVRTATEEPGPSGENGSSGRHMAFAILLTAALTVVTILSVLS